MAHPVPTEGFLQPSSEGAISSQPNTEIHLLPSVPPFLLVSSFVAVSQVLNITQQQLSLITE